MKQTQLAARPDFGAEDVVQASLHRYILLIQAFHTVGMVWYIRYDAREGRYEVLVKGHVSNTPRLTAPFHV